jgi:hypothetical protein
MFDMKEEIMFKFFKTRKNDTQTTSSAESERRASGCRRVSFDTKYLGLGKCIDRRQTVRRKSDQFDRDAYERTCQERLGPGWL